MSSGREEIDIILSDNDDESYIYQRLNGTRMTRSTNIDRIEQTDTSQPVTTNRSSLSRTHSLYRHVIS